MRRQGFTNQKQTGAPVILCITVYTDPRKLLYKHSPVINYQACCKLGIDLPCYPNLENPKSGKVVKKRSVIWSCSLKHPCCSGAAAPHASYGKLARRPMSWPQRLSTALQGRDSVRPSCAAR